MNNQFIEQCLAKQKQQLLYRQVQPVDYQSANKIVIGEKEYINFSSNDYLALNHHPDINKALQEGADRFGVCSSASSLITGYSYAHQTLEETISTWLNKPKALLFNSGFSANTAILKALSKSHCQFLVDKLAHASLIDGAFKEDNKAKRYLHNDHIQLENYLSKNTLAPKVILSEGVFSMDGDSSDIGKLTQLANSYDAMLYIDDAHSIGVHGTLGQGSSSVSSDIDIVMATLGKAIATQGAFVATNE